MNALRNVHPAAAAAQANFHPHIVAEVAAAIAANRVVVIGMAWNASVRRVRALLDAEKIPYTYIEYGNYLSMWRQRLAIKLWSGWPTFPQVFIGGTLVGGNSDVVKLKASGELATLVAAA
jgi:glutaredoxin-related protein